jgi:hypothetical protein
LVLQADEKFEGSLAAGSQSVVNFVWLWERMAFLEECGYCRNREVYVYGFERGTPLTHLIVWSPSWRQKLRVKITNDAREAGYTAVCSKCGNQARLSDEDKCDIETLLAPENQPGD